MNMDYSELDFVCYLHLHEGTCTVTDNEGNRISVKAGESVLFPLLPRTWKLCRKEKYLSWKLTYNLIGFILIAESFSLVPVSGRERDSVIFYKSIR